METATLKDGRTLQFKPDKIGDGAMKEVYFTHDRQSVVCFYKDAKTAADPIRMQRLDRILGRNNPTVPKAQGGAATNDAEAAYFRNLFCWPTALVTKPRFGIVAPTYPGHFFFQTGPDFIKGKEKNGMRFIGRKNRSLLEKFAPEELGDFQMYLSLCVRMARAVARLHTAGLAHSDLSPNNVLVDPTRGACIVIDVDSLVVEGLFPPDVIGTKGYIAPEVLATVHLKVNDPQRKHPNARTDLHALAVLIYQYLLRRHPLDGKKVPNARTAEEQDLLSYGKEALFSEHPTDASNRPDEKNYMPATAMGAQLSDLFQRAFVKGLHAPNDRPAALEWVRGLTRAWDMLQPCPANCKQKWYILPEKNPKCCHCGAKPRGPAPVLKFYSERRPGQWLADGQVAVYHNQTLFKWHAFDDVFPGGFDVDRTPQAYCATQAGQWLLVNQNLQSLTSPGGNRVPPGQAVVLKQGVEFRLSQEAHGRKAVVEMVQP
jgi:serine/threonine protein kinase